MGILSSLVDESIYLIIGREKIAGRVIKLRPSGTNFDSVYAHRSFKDSTITRITERGTYDRVTLHPTRRMLILNKPYSGGKNPVDHRKAD